MRFLHWFVDAFGCTGRSAARSPGNRRLNLLFQAGKPNQVSKNLRQKRVSRITEESYFGPRLFSIGSRIFAATPGRTEPGDGAWQ
jgi:hypothetical protein